MAETLAYACAGEPPFHGDWVEVPLGRRRVLGLVLDSSASESEPAPHEIDPERIRDICGRIQGLPSMDPEWIRFITFAARYYRRPLGTILVGLVPKWLRDLGNFTPRGKRAVSSLERLLSETGLTADASHHLSHPEQPKARKNEKAITDCEREGRGPGGSRVGGAADTASVGDSYREPALTSVQQTVLAELRSPGVHVLHGVTGSGKTRIYTELARNILHADPSSQVLVMVPEIGLTPQLVERFRRAFPDVPTVILHSEITERERAKVWLLAASGKARLVIGTRLSIMTPIPRLRLIVVDEEHDPSYKQQEGMRYSARDLAVWRSRQLGITLVLGSATPSIETWAQIARGRYTRHRLADRATGEPPAPIRIIDTLRDPAREGLSEESRGAIARVLGEGGQVMVFLNRRGYAPVLSCSSCGWSSNCPECGVAVVLHRQFAANAARGGNGLWQLQCHHCGLTAPVPRQCPDCGDPDLQPIGRGVQRLEQTLTEAFPQARVLRIDRDTVRQGKALAEQIARIEAGEVDIVVGTQMLAKGHDFARMRLVVVADSDTQLLNPDFRAPERLFATLIQVAGRAGRHGHSGSPAEVLIQTRYPQHPLYGYLSRQDVDGFAKAEMKERGTAGLPPYVHMAAIRASHADARRIQSALKDLREQLREHSAEEGWAVSIHGPVPRYPEVLAGRWRGQLLLEAASRADLHRLLAVSASWVDGNRSFDPHLDIDPLEV
jgi:primosomal protein N' (replication factor Y)